MSTTLGELVARGSRSCVYAVGAAAVAKVPNATTPDSWITCEARYCVAAYQAGAPAPRLLGIETINGRTTSVWERVRAVSMWEELLLHPGDLEAHARTLAEVQHGLFQLVPLALLPRQHDRRSCKIRRAAALVDPSLAAALDLLPGPPPAPRLCHGDLHPGNVLLSEDGPVIIDWFDASRGHPECDVARSAVLLLPDFDTSPAHLPGGSVEMLTAFEHAYTERAVDLADITTNDLVRWRRIEVAARLAEGVADASLAPEWGRMQAS